MALATLDELREKLHDRKLTVVAEKTGLHYNTVYRLAKGMSTDPAYSVVKRISEYFEQEGAVNDGCN